MHIDSQTLNYAPLWMLVIVSLVLIYVVMSTRKTSRELAKKRDHSHSNTVYEVEPSEELKLDLKKLEKLEQKVAELERRLHHTQQMLKEEENAGSSTDMTKEGVS